MHIKKIIRCLLSLIIIFTFVQTSYSQKYKDKITNLSERKITKPNLNGHNFINLFSVKSPFINTSFNFTMGGGQTVGFELPPVVIDSVTVINTVKGDVAFTSINFEYQAKLRDWLSFWGNIQLNGRLGTKLRSVFAQGINVSTGYEFGWLFKLWENKNNMMSGAVKLSNYNYSVIDLRGFVKKIIETGGISEDNKLFQSIPSLSVSGELRHSIALSRSLGITSFIEIGSGESIKRDEGTKGIFLLGIAADYDFLPKTNVPLGFSLGYFLNSKPNLSEDRFGNPQNIISKISYTGSSDMNAGIEISYEWSKVGILKTNLNTNSESLKFLNLNGSFRYYF